MHAAFTSISVLAASSVIGPVFLGLVLLATVAIFGKRASELLAFVRLGKPVNRLDDLPKRLENEATVVLGQRKLLQRFGPGIMHA
ncbi:MAG TPA: hypothetical protein VKK30_04245, partial [Actinomycetota bacterium]|nr:hypothetical protein [Actinomycetota bacterium]